MEPWICLPGRVVWPRRVRTTYGHHLVQGDITSQQVDAVVNAANRAMRGGGGVDGAIHRGGGPAILQDCIAAVPQRPRHRRGGLDHGRASCRRAGSSTSSGPNHGAGETDRGLLTSCYRRAIEVGRRARRRDHRVPAGLGRHLRAGHLQDAADAAVETLRAAKSSVREARLVAFGQSAYDALTLRCERSLPRALGRRPASRDLPGTGSGSYQANAGARERSGAAGFGGARACLVEHDLADPHRVGRHLDALVLAAELQGLLERQPPRRHQLLELVGVATARW